MPHCANEYTKEKEEEKEKNATMFTKYHGELLMTIYEQLFV